MSVRAKAEKADIPADEQSPGVDGGKELGDARMQTMWRQLFRWGP